TAGGKMDELFRVAFAEDKEILEAIELEEKKAKDHRPLRISIDKGSNLYRIAMEKMIAAEGL
ncbi:MAG: hypothetical protein ACR2OR_12890, partial [Hyphomicrobiales bacterium]